MKVAHFLPHYPGREGTTSFCRALSKALNSLDLGSSLVISFKPEKCINEDHVVSYASDSRNPFSIPEQLRQDLRDNILGLDGMVLHGAFNPRMAAMARILRKIELPYIFMPHDPYVPALMNHGRLKKLIYWKFFEKPVMDYARGMILLSKSHEKPLRKRGYSGDVAVVANGCDKSEVVESRREKNVGVRRIQYLGRMDRNHKGLDLLIEAFARFSADKAGMVKLFLSGNDWVDRNCLEQQVVGLNAENRIHFTGPREESANEVFMKADLAVLPSRFDGFGLTIVEAMQSGCPVLVSDACGVAEHVKVCGGGWVCPPNVEGIRQALESAWQSRAEWYQFGERAQDYVLNHLTWKQAAQKSAVVYGAWFG